MTTCAIGSRKAQKATRLIVVWRRVTIVNKALCPGSNDLGPPER
jgi:hypothetical protein